MSGIGSQGSFQAPHIPQKSAREKQRGGAAIAKTTKTITKPASANTAKVATTTAKPEPQKIVEKQTEQAQNKHSETVQDLRNNIAKSRQRADSFQKHVSSGDSSQKINNKAELAAKVEKDKDLRQRATEFAKKINSQQAAANSNIRKPSVDKPEQQQNHQIAAQAVQSKDFGSSKKSKKKAQDNLDAKLEKIFSLGGERGKKFVAFIQREQSKGPLLESTIDLIDDFYLTIKGDSLSSSELLVTGDENLSLVKSMVSSENLTELDSIKDALSKSVVNSAGERGDLLALRNAEKNQSRIAPPSPSQEAKKLPTELAIEFVSSINQGSIKAPWDTPLMLA